MLSAILAPLRLLRRGARWCLDRDWPFCVAGWVILANLLDRLAVPLGGPDVATDILVFVGATLALPVAVPPLVLLVLLVAGGPPPHPTNSA